MAKFILPLGSHIGGKGQDPCHVVPSFRLYGPYADHDLNAAKLRFAVPGQEAHLLILEGELVTVEAAPDVEPMHRRREPGNLRNYDKDEQGALFCRACHSPTIDVRIVHPVHSKLYGFKGENREATAPACPQCDNTYNPVGAPCFVDP